MQDPINSTGHERQTAACECEATKIQSESLLHQRQCRDVVVVLKRVRGCTCDAAQWRQQVRRCDVSGPMQRSIMKKDATNQFDRLSVCVAFAARLCLCLRLLFSPVHYLPLNEQSRVHLSVNQHLQTRPEARLPQRNYMTRPLSASQAFRPNESALGGGQTLRAHNAAAAAAPDNKCFQDQDLDLQLSAADLTLFQHLCRTVLQSSNAHQRKAAEEEFSSLQRQQPNKAIQAMIQTIAQASAETQTQSQDKENASASASATYKSACQDSVKQFCCVMMRSSIEKVTPLAIWRQSLNHDQRQLVKSQLLHLVFDQPLTATSAPIKRALVDVIGAILQQEAIMQASINVAYQQAQQQLQAQQQAQRVEFDSHWPQLLDRVVRSATSLCASGPAMLTAADQTASLLTLLHAIDVIGEFTTPPQVTEAKTQGQAEAEADNRRQGPAKPQSPLEPHLGTIVPLLLAALSSCATKEVRMASMRACVSLLLSLPSDLAGQSKQCVSQMLPHLFQCLMSAASARDDAFIQSAVSVLLQVIRHNLSLIKPHFVEITNCMILLARDSDQALDEASTAMAFEFLLTCCEEGKALARRHASLGPQCIDLALHFMQTGMQQSADADSLAQWESAIPPFSVSKDLDTEFFCEETDSERLKIGAQAIGRLSQCLSAQVFFKQIHPIVQRCLLDAQHWTARFVGLTILNSSINEETYTAIEGDLQALLQMLLPYCGEKESCPRVRHAAIDLLIVLCANGYFDDNEEVVDDPRTLCEREHSKIMPALMPSLDTSRPHSVRVCVHACTALIECIQMMAFETYRPYIDSLLTSVLALLAPQQPLLVQQCAISIVAASALQASESLEQETAATEVDRENSNSNSLSPFEPYFAHFYPGVKQIVCSATRDDQKTLRGKAIECLGTLVEAVGPKRYEAGEAAQIAQLLLQVKQAVVQSALAAPNSDSVDVDDALVLHIDQCLARLFRCRGCEEFAALMPLVIPPLLASAGCDNACAILDQDQLSLAASAEPSRVSVDEAGYESIALEFQRGQGKKVIKINTHKLKAKENSLSILWQYIDMTRESGIIWAPFAEETLALCCQCVRYSFSEDVRLTSAAMLEPLMQCVESATKAMPNGESLVSDPQASPVSRMFHALFPPLCQSMRQEVHSDNLVDITDCMTSCIARLPCHAMTDSELIEISQLLQRIMAESILRIQQRDKLLAAPSHSIEEIDAEEAAKLESDNASEQNLLNQCYQLLAALTKANKARYASVFTSHLYPLCSQLLSADNTDLVIIALCCIGQVCADCFTAENSGEEARATAAHLQQQRDQAQQLFTACSQHLASEARCPLDAQNNDLIQSAAFGFSAACRCLRSRIPIETASECARFVLALVRRDEARSEDRAPATDNCVSCLSALAQHVFACHSPVQHAGAIQALYEAWLQCLPCFGGDMQESCQIHDHLLQLAQQHSPNLLATPTSVQIQSGSVSHQLTLQGWPLVYTLFSLIMPREHEVTQKTVSGMAELILAHSAADAGAAFTAMPPNARENLARLMQQHQHKHQKTAQ